MRSMTNTAAVVSANFQHDDVLIDRVETKRRFGHDGFGLTVGSGKHVVYRCCDCATEVETEFRRLKANLRCRKCQGSHPDTQRKYQEAVRVKFRMRAKAHPSIDDEETQKRFGYTSKDLGPQSDKRVVYRCLVCGNLKEATRQSLRGSIHTCRSCLWKRDGFRQNNLQSHRRSFLARTFDLPKDVVVDREETIKRYGYPPEALKPSSGRPVVMVCGGCQKSITILRRTLRPNRLCKKCFSSSDEWRQRRSQQAKQRAQKITDWSSQVAKRKKTINERYEGGCPWLSWSTGTAENRIRRAIEGLTGLDAVKSFTLPSGKHIDIYFPSYHVGVEYNGLHYHHEKSPEPRGRSYHQDKTKSADAVGIRLLHIFEDEWRDRRHAVEGILKAAFGVYDVKIGARECLLRVIPSKEAAIFMEKEHLQDASHSALAAWGLFHEERLVAAITVSKHPRNGYPDTYALDRLCFANGVHVVGGASRLLKPLLAYAARAGMKRVVSWSDNRWATGKVYEAMGFIKEKDLKPDYCYVEVKNPKRRISKQSMKKTDAQRKEGITESEHAKRLGLAKIWDCGKVRWSIQVR